ncbi:hypothetical protein H5410_016133 [Solanum commersonii]|uniref:Uncharacterized protein n=1 Tax=Solanum commersonii TaxID=4109 RepID=A0A9J5ZVE5_SOLCO|nr:hypothetical protein H5410_016133 [Solanum commersonii]
MEKRLATWKMQYLSMGGRLTLINSVLDSIPTCCMSLFPIPSSILKKMDRLRRRFLWEGNILTHKYSLGKWQSVTQPKTQGGLGIRNLKLHNNILFMKWLWRYGQTGTGFWRDVIKAKYGIQDHWCPKESNEPHGVGVWKHISSFQDDFFQEVSFKSETLESTTLVVEDLDRILWGNSKEKAYTVKKCYKNMSSQMTFFNFGLGNMYGKLGCLSEYLVAPGQP